MGDINCWRCDKESLSEDDMHYIYNDDEDPVCSDCLEAIKPLLGDD
jgi:hypothetical protein